MSRLLLLVPLLLAVPTVVSAQASSWRPPSSEMPMMPKAAEIRGDWLGPRAAWFRGLDGVAGVSASGLRASGEPRSGSEFVQIARFTSGPLPVVIWSDRNGDGRCDMLEIYRGGSVAYQLIDADYDGTANVLRVYDDSGSLQREQRL